MAKSTAAKNEAGTIKAGLKTGTKLGTTGTKVGKGAAAKKPAATKPAKAPKEKGEARKGRVGTDLAYTVVNAKENPFREGTIRAELWAHIKASKSTAAARALDGRISSAFMQDLADKEIIKFS